MAKGAESSLQSCTVLFCTIKWRGGQPWDNRLLSLKRRPAAPEESSLFSPYGCSRLAGCCARRSRMLGIWTRQVRCPLQHEGEQQGLPGNTAGTPQGSQALLKRLGTGSTCGWREIPILLDLESQNPHRANAPMGQKTEGAELVPCR